MRSRLSGPISGGPILIVEDKERSGALFRWDASGSFEDRAQFDGEAKEFAYLVIDPLPFTIYIKQSSVSADWSIGQQIKATPAQSVEAADEAAFRAEASRLQAVEEAVKSALERAEAERQVRLAVAQAQLANTQAVYAAAQVELARQQVELAKNKTDEAKVYAANAAAYATLIGRVSFDFNLDSEPNANNDWNV